MRGERGLWTATTVVAAWILVAAFLSVGEGRMTDDILAVRTKLAVPDAIDRLERVVVAAGFSVVARVDHGGGARAVGLPLRPTQLLLFANPRGGTPLMQCDQRVGLDLPLRALAWEGADGQVWVAMPNPRLLKARYGLGPDCDAALARMAEVVGRILAELGPA